MTFSSNETLAGSFEDWAELGDILTAPSAEHHPFGGHHPLRHRLGREKGRRCISGSDGAQDTEPEPVEFIEPHRYGNGTPSTSKAEERWCVASPCPEEVDGDDCAASTSSNNYKSTSAPRRKKPKVRSGPRRPLSAYNMFFRSYRIELMKNSGGNSVPFATMGKQVGEKWQSLKAEERRIWEEKAEVDSMRYQEELKSYKVRAKQRVLSEPVVTGNHGRNRANTELEGAATWLSRYPTSSPPETFPFRTEVPCAQTARCEHSHFRLSATDGDNHARGRTKLRVGVGKPETGELSEDRILTSGLPPSGTEIPWPDTNGRVVPHTMSWKVYSVKSSQVKAFIEQITVGLQQQATKSNNAVPPALAPPVSSRSSSSSWYQHTSTDSALTRGGHSTGGPHHYPNFS